MAGPARQLNTALGQPAAVVHDGCHLLGTTLQADDQLFDLFSGLLRALGQAAHLVGHHGKAAPGLTGTRRLNGGVKGQQVGLLGHGFDHVEHTADLVAFALEFTHGHRGITHFGGQALDLGDGFTHHLVAFTGLLVGSHGGFRGLFGIARHFLHGGRHLVHGGGHLVGLDLLAVDPGAGLFGHGRQLLGGAGDLGDPVADPADQLAQAHGHALHGALQLAQFVLAARFQVVAQVAGGHALGDFEGLVQRDNDLAGNGPGREDADDQRQHGGKQQQVFGLRGICVTHGGLGDGEFFTVAQQDVALGDHGFQRCCAGDLGIAILADGGTVGLQ